MESPTVIGRYAIYGKIASGGMGSVHLGRLRGAAGFSRTVAIKRLHPQYTEDADFVSMFLDEARVAARVRHPNVVPTLDVVAESGEVVLVLEYIHGATLAQLLRAVDGLESRIPIPILGSIISGMLHGLHAAHEAKDEGGQPLDIVHRDVSPQNVMVGVDGVPRVLDFGVAKAAGRLMVTRDGQLKGKLAYMSPEQVTGKSVTRRSDVYAAAVVLWEALTQRRLFKGDNDGALLEEKLWGTIDPPSRYAPDVSAALDAIVLRGLARDPNARYATAREMAGALEDAAVVAIAPVVGAWVERTVASTLARQAADVAEIESTSDHFDASVGTSAPPGPVAPRDAAARQVRATMAKAREARAARETDGGDASRSEAPDDAQETAMASSSMPRLIAVMGPRPRRMAWASLGLAALAAMFFVGSRWSHAGSVTADDGRTAADSVARAAPPPVVVGGANKAVSPSPSAASAPSASGASPEVIAPSATVVASATAAPSPITAPRRLPVPGPVTPVPMREPRSVAGPRASAEPAPAPRPSATPVYNPSDHL